MRGRTTPSHEGAYSGPQAARIAGISYRRLDYWARKGFVRPSLQNPRRGSGRYRLYSTLDILALKVARRLRDQGVSLRTIRRAIQTLRKGGLLGQDPLTHYTFFVQGKKLYVLTDDPSKAVEISQGAQLVFAITLEGLAGPKGLTSVREATVGWPGGLVNQAVRL